MKINKTILKKMIIEAFESKVDEDGGLQTGQKVQTQLAKGPVEAALEIVAREIEASQNNQKKANIFVTLLQKVGLDTVEEFQALKSRLQTTFGKAAPAEPGGDPNAPPLPESKSFENVVERAALEKGSRNDVKEVS